MSICNECWGKGWIKKQGVQFDCRKCKGTGVIENEPHTNEEWFCSLPTKDKAKFLEAQQKHGGTIASRSDVDWEVWLKEKHND